MGETWRYPAGFQNESGIYGISGFLGKYGLSGLYGKCGQNPKYYAGVMSLSCGML